MVDVGSRYQQRLSGIGQVGAVPPANNPTPHGIVIIKRIKGYRREDGRASVIHRPVKGLSVLNAIILSASVICDDLNGELGGWNNV